MISKASDIAVLVSWAEQKSGPEGISVENISQEQWKVTLTRTGHEQGKMM